MSTGTLRSGRSAASVEACRLHHRRSRPRCRTGGHRRAPELHERMRIRGGKDLEDVGRRGFVPEVKNCEAESGLKVAGTVLAGDHHLVALLLVIDLLDRHFLKTWSKVIDASGHPHRNLNDASTSFLPVATAKARVVQRLSRLR